MYFDSLHAALVMGGHGSFVWGAYVATLLVIVALLLLPVLRRRRLLRQVATELRRRDVAGAIGEGTS